MSMLLVLVASILGAIGPFLFQQAAKAQVGHALVALVNPWAIAGMASYLTVMLLFTQAFRLGGTVKVLYPIYATTFVWAAVISLLYFGQPVRPIHIVGMGLLVAGIVCMSW
ncbi:MAG: hypothetical protein R3C10_06530 [Pirellulales bacterium]